MENAVTLTSQSVRDAEKVSGDDVAQVRTGILSRSDLDNIKASADVLPESSGMNVSYSFVANSNPSGAGMSDSNEQKTNDNSQEGRDNLDLLLEIAEAFNVLLPSKDNSDQVTSPSVPPTPTKQNANMNAANNPKDFFHLANSAWLSERSDDPINEFTDMHDRPSCWRLPSNISFWCFIATRRKIPYQHQVN